jgi:diaminohydroxyphosphoribosylaminopyrimidine deaminase / 5-amino-6-(5-phosphoribosylamino)uracil reductase
VTRKPHEYWMAQALALARQGEGLTRPNPPVGAVVVKNGRRVGAGFHRKAGGPHAEVLALKQAGRRARGATLYVTLEPCSTWGRTPPCTDAILASGIARVAVGVRDPNPRHAGRGLALLRRRGVDVMEGVRARECAALIEPFAKWMEQRRPFVTLKLGMSLDGRLADRRGRSRWITGSAARNLVQGLRRRVDAVLVGGGTVRKDNPSLLPRPDHGRKPFRVVVASGGDIPRGAQVLTDGHQDQTLVVVAKSCSMRTIADLRGRGVAVSVCGAARVSLPRLMAELGRRGILHVLCEGGGELAEALIRAKRVDEFLFFVAPCILGGRDAVPAVGGAGWPIEAKPELRILDVGRAGSDVMIRARPK